MFSCMSRILPLQVKTNIPWHYKRPRLQKHQHFKDEDPLFADLIFNMELDNVEGGSETSSIGTQLIQYKC